MFYTTILARNLSKYLLVFKSKKQGGCSFCLVVHSKYIIWVFRLTARPSSYTQLSFFEEELYIRKTTKSKQINENFDMIITFTVLAQCKKLLDDSITVKKLLKNAIISVIMFNRVVNVYKSIEDRKTVNFWHYN